MDPEISKAPQWFRFGLIALLSVQLSGCELFRGWFGEGDTPEEPPPTSPAAPPHPVAVLDHFEPGWTAPLGELPLGADGSYLIPAGGTYELEAQGFCLASDRSPPSADDAYAYEPISAFGPLGPIVGKVLRGYVSRPEMTPELIQALLWNITDCTSTDGMNEEVLAAARALLTEEELAQINQYAASCPRNVGATTNHAQLKQAALAARESVQDDPESEFPRGRWSYLPEEGYFIRLLLESYRLIRIQIYVPEPVSVTRDAQGRILSVQGPGGEKIETSYDDSVSGPGISGEPGLTAHAFLQVRVQYRDPEENGALVQRELRDTGWVFKGLPAGGGLAETSVPSRFEGLAERYTQAVAFRNSLRPGSPGAADSQELAELASYAEAVRAAFSEDEQVSAFAPAVAWKAWQNAYVDLASPASEGAVESRPLAQAARGGGRPLKRFDPASGLGSSGNKKRQPVGLSGRKSEEGKGKDVLKRARHGVNVINGVTTAVDGLGSLGGDIHDLGTWGASSADLGDVVEGIEGGLDIPGTLAQKLINWQLDTAAEISEALGGDPPRPDFDVIASPVIPTPYSPLPSGERMTPARAAALTEFFSSLRELSLNLRAALVTRDRYGGAEQAGDAHWMIQQELAFMRLKDVSGRAMIRTSKAIESLMAVLDSEQVKDVTLTPQEFEQFQAQLRSEGFSADWQEAARLSGVSPADMEKSRQRLLALDPGEATSASVRTAIRDSAEAWAALGAYWMRLSAIQDVTSASKAAGR